MASALQTETAGLLASVSARDTEAIAELLDQFRIPVRAFVRLCVGAELRQREAATDLLNEICFDLLVEQMGHQMCEGPRFKLWLFTAALTEFVARQREVTMPANGARKYDPDRDELTMLFARVSMPRQQFSGSEHRLRLEAAFDRLPLDLRQALALSRIVGIPHAAIARWSGTSLIETRRRLGAALAALGEAQD